MNKHNSEHRFFSVMSVLTLVLVFVGFGNTYGAKIISGAEPVPLIIHIHGAIFSTWIIAFVLQALLIMNRKIEWHKRIGHAATVLGGAMLISGVLTARWAARTGHLGIPGVEFPTREGFLFLNVAAVSVFVIFATLGWFFRNQPVIHKRLMLMAAVAGLAPPGISRLPFLSGNTPAIAVAVTMFLFVGPIYDWITRGKPHKVYIFGLPLVAFSLPPVVLALSATDTWKSFALILIGTEY